MLEDDDGNDFQHLFISILPRGPSQHYGRLVRNIGHWPKYCLGNMVKMLHCAIIRFDRMLISSSGKTSDGKNGCREHLGNRREGSSIDREPPRGCMDVPSVDEGIS